MEIFVKLSLHINTWSYLEDKPICFIRLSDSNTKNFNKHLIGLDTIVTNPNNDQQLNQQDLIDLKAEQV